MRGGLRSRSAAVLACAVVLASAEAQTLPAPPTSPAPVVNYEYDAEGNPTKMIQAPGVTGFNFATQSTYDALNRPRDTTDAKTGKTQFGYDGLDRTLQITDPRNLVTQYPRNGLGDATQLISPDTGTASMTYDAAGNLKTRTDSRGVLATYGYDALNRMISVVYTQSGQPSQTFGWQYDLGTVTNGIGRLGQADHPGGFSRYGYDAQGRVVSVVQQVNATTGANSAALTHTVGYEYDSAGHLTGITYPSGRKLIITYTAGQPTAIGLAKDAGSAASPLLSQIQWQPFGGAKSWQWEMATGQQLYERTYDTSGRLVRYRLGNVIRDLTYDAVDRITSYTHYDATTAAAQPALDQTFGYDELGRLTNITTATSSWSIGYDANGNRTGVTLNGDSSGYTVSSTSNRIDSISNPARVFGYDGAGNTTADGNYTASYDLSGRLATLTKAGTTTTYTYNAHGQRVRKFGSTGSSTTVVFVYDLNGQLLGEYDQNGATTREYVWLGSTPIAVFTPDPADGAAAPLVYFIHADHIDTPRVVVDKNNNVRWRWVVEPFGTTAPEADPSSMGVFTQNLRFPGQYFDQESGLHYNYFRSYDSSVGRYTQSDPIGLGGGINTYAYVEGSPIGFTDPMGLEKVNLLGPHDSGQWAQSNLPDDPNMLIITAHGNPFVVVDYRDLSKPNRMDARKLEDFIRKNTKWKEGMPIHLDVCTAGEGANSIAKQLAIGMHTRVRAATDIVQTFFPFNMGTPGEWRWFSPDGGSVGNGSRFP